MKLEDTLYKLTTLVPKGKVTTYAELATAAGIRNPRVVGNILHKNPNPAKIPCHRVVNKEGQVAKSYAFGGRQAQIKKLNLEKVEVKNNAVDLGEYLWRPRESLVASLLENVKK
jgi:O-6-methylguanine DNA methyltransferase